MSVLRAWSPVLGCMAARVSAFDKRGGEHYAVIPQAATGRQNRALRLRAAEAVERAAASGRDPGEVEMDELQGAAA